MNDIRLIAAMGSKREIGLNNELPWGDAFTDDRINFAKMTTGGMLIAGMRTFLSIAHLNGTKDRLIFIDDHKITPNRASDHSKRMCNGIVWIVGGAKTYARWMPYVERFYITVLPWTGEADTFMPLMPFESGYAQEKIK